MILTGALLPFLVLAEPHRFSMLDFWEGKCGDGDARACRRLEEGRAGAEKLARLERRALQYGETADRGKLEKDGRPLLDLAYKQVMEDFIAAEHEAGNRELYYDEAAIDYCGGHFHNYWVNKKLWWPTDADNAPDWADIYYYIVDHYHGICLRRHFNRR